MTPTLREVLTQAKNGTKSEFVVEVGRAGSRHSKDFLTSYYPKIAQKAGGRSFLHKLRHTYVSQLVQNGVGLYEVSKLLGHSSIQMTEIYAHLVPANLQQAAMGMTPRKIPELNILRSTKNISK